MRRQNNSCLSLYLQLIILVSSNYFLFNVNFTNHSWIFRFICSLVTWQLLFCTSTGFIEAFSIWCLLLSSHHYLPVFKILVYHCLGENFWGYCLRRMRGAGSVCCIDKTWKSQTINTNFCGSFPLSWCPKLLLHCWFNWDLLARKVACHSSGGF